MTKHLCKCICHKSGVNIVHFMACCDTCRVCKQQIAFGKMKEHMEDCNPKVSGTFLVYLFADTFGNTAYAVTEESSDTIQVCGLRDSLGNPIYFDSEAYHCSVWCDENNVQYRRVESEFTLPLRGE